MESSNYCEENVCSNLQENTCQNTPQSPNQLAWRPGKNDPAAQAKCSDLLLEACGENPSIYSEQALGPDCNGTEADFIKEQIAEKIGDLIKECLKEREAHFKPYRRKPMLNQFEALDFISTKKTLNSIVDPHDLPHSFTWSGAKSLAVSIVLLGDIRSRYQKLIDLAEQIQGSPIKSPPHGRRKHEMLPYEVGKIAYEVVNAAITTGWFEVGEPYDYWKSSPYSSGYSGEKEPRH